ncbi:glycerol-3-phosphate 1-O-acyltransferase [bacterium]|nr:glycerol-3-phosphate 1-O-acyltransferase [bacterium]
MFVELTTLLAIHPAALAVVSFFLGSIPFSLLVSKAKGIDLRSIGSGNLGATNVYRAMGFKYAALVFALDAIKGAIPTWISLSNESPTIHIGIACIAIVGHSLSPFVKFKGGKGAATGLGVLSVLATDVFGILFIVAAILIGVTRYVAPTTIVCSLLAPLLLYWFNYPIPYVVFTSLISAFIIYRHRTNITRLIQGKENRV